MRKGWEFKKLNEVCEKGTSNIVINKLTDNKGKYPLFGASGLVKNIDFFHQDKPYIGIVKDGAGVGRVNIYPAYSSLVGTMQYIFPKEGYSIDFIKYFLVKLDLSHCVSGATIPHIYFKDYGKENIPTPSLATQLAIVTELDKINELIRLKKEQLKDFDNLAQSLFYEMFGDPVENEKGWEVHLLKALCTKIGSGATPKGGSESYKEEGTSLIRSLNIHNNEFKFKDLAYIDDDQADSLNNVIVQGNDVLLNITGASVARCCIVPTEVLPARVNQHVCILRHGNLIDAKYLNRLLTNDNYQQLLQRLAKSKAATREALPKSIVDKLSIPLPPLPLQRLFAQRIGQIEREKSEVQKSIQDLETLLASRMQYWFE